MFCWRAADAYVRARSTPSSRPAVVLPPAPRPAPLLDVRHGFAPTAALTGKNNDGSVTTRLVTVSFIIIQLFFFFVFSILYLFFARVPVRRTHDAPARPDTITVPVVPELPYGRAVPNHYVCYDCESDTDSVLERRRRSSFEIVGQNGKKNFPENPYWNRNEHSADQCDDTS